MKATALNIKTISKNFLRIFLTLFIIMTLVMSTQSFYAERKGAKSSESLISTNTDLVAPSVNGLMSILTEYVAGAITSIVDNFTSQFDPVSDYFYTITNLGSASNSFFDFFYYLGYFLTLTVFAFSIFMVALSGFFDNKNRAIELLVRLLVGCVLIYLSRRILDLIDDSFKTLWDRIAEPSEFYSEAKVDVSSMSGSLGLISLVLMIAFVIEFIKFVLEIMERYIVVKLLYISSPAAMGMVVSRTTSAITVNYLRMYFSQLLLLLYNKFFTYLLSAMTAAVLVEQIYAGKSGITPWLFLIASCKAAQRVDSYMKSLGLTVAQTGSAVLDSVMGAVHALGKGWGAAKGGAGFVGAAQMNLGAATGNYGLYKAGESKQAFAKGGITGAITPRSEAQTLSSFAKAGGVDAANKVGSETSKRALSNAMVNSYNNGDYGTLGGFDTATQTEAARNILKAGGESGRDAFRDATGFNAESILSAHFNNKGEIEGTFRTGRGKGQISTFKVSPEELKGKSGTIATTDGKFKNIQTRGNIKAADDQGSYEYTEGGISNLSSMTGLDLDDDRLSSLGAKHYMIDRDDNMLYIADDTGELVYARGLETGNEMWGSIDKPLAEGEEQENQYSAEKANEDSETAFEERNAYDNGTEQKNIDEPLRVDDEIVTNGEETSGQNNEDEIPEDKPLSASADSNITENDMEESPEGPSLEEIENRNTLNNNDGSDNDSQHATMTKDEHGNRVVAEASTNRRKASDTSNKFAPKDDKSLEQRSEKKEDKTRKGDKKETSASSNEEKVGKVNSTNSTTTKASSSVTKGDTESSRISNSPAPSLKDDKPLSKHSTGAGKDIEPSKPSAQKTQPMNSNSTSSGSGNMKSSEDSKDNSKPLNKNNLNTATPAGTANASSFSSKTAETARTTLNTNSTSDGSKTMSSNSKAHSPSDKNDKTLRDNAKEPASSEEDIAANISPTGSDSRNASIKASNGHFTSGGSKGSTYAPSDKEDKTLSERSEDDDWFDMDKVNAYITKESDEAQSPSATQTEVKDTDSTLSTARSNSPLDNSSSASINNSLNTPSDNGDMSLSENANASVSSRNARDITSDNTSSISSNNRTYTPSDNDDMPLSENANMPVSSTNVSVSGSSPTSYTSAKSEDNHASNDSSHGVSNNLTHAPSGMDDKPLSKRNERDTVYDPRTILAEFEELARGLEADASVTPSTRSGSTVRTSPSTANNATVGSSSTSHSKSNTSPAASVNEDKSLSKHGSDASFEAYAKTNTSSTDSRRETPPSSTQGNAGSQKAGSRSETIVIKDIPLSNRRSSTSTQTGPASTSTKSNRTPTASSTNSDTTGPVRNSSNGTKQSSRKSDSPTSSNSEDQPLNKRSSGSSSLSGKTTPRETANTTGKTTAAKEGTKTYPTPNVSPKDFRPGGKFESYAPQGLADVKRHPDRNSVTFTTNAKSSKDSGQIITVTGLRGKIKDIGSDDDSKFIFDGKKINLNNKNIKIIDNGNNGSYAVKVTDKDTKKISKP